ETLTIADLHVADLRRLLAWNSAKHQEAAEVIHALAVHVIRRPLPGEMDAVAGGLSGEVRDRPRPDLIGAARVGLQTTRGDGERGAEGECRRSWQWQSPLVPNAPSPHRNARRRRCLIFHMFVEEREFL